jgi:hypothetical protein
MKREIIIITLLANMLLIIGSNLSNSFRTQRIYQAMFNISNSQLNHNTIKKETICQVQKQILLFDINNNTMTKFPAMVELIVCSEVLNKNEKQYWINTLINLNIEQFDKLHILLLEEKKKLKELPEKYQNQLRELNDKYNSH